MDCRRRVVGALQVAVLLVLVPEAAWAQRRGELIEGLVRGFIESQLEKERRKTLQRQQAAQRGPQLQPPQYHAERRGDPRQSVSSNVQQYRRTLSAFARETDSLAGGLQQSVVRVRGVRPLMPEVLKVKATAAVLARHSQEDHRLPLLRQQYCELDCQWRNLSFRLRQLQGLSRPAAAQIRQLDGYSHEICELLQLEPQFDRKKVFRLMVEASAHLDHLLDDILFELSALPEAEPLAGQCRGLAEQCRRLSRASDEMAYDQLMTKYSAFVSDWRKFATKVYPLENVRCDRSLRRIHRCTAQIFEQLWVPPTIDRAYLRHLSEQLALEVDSLFENMTVKALVQLPVDQQQEVLTMARRLYSRCERYCECVSGDSPLNDLRSEYIQINNLWGSLDRHLSPITSKTVVTTRRLITDYDGQLRVLLQVPERFDRSRAIRLAASLEELASHLRYDVRRYGRYYQSPVFRSRAYQASDAFSLQAKYLHANLQQNARLEDLQSRCQAALTDWEAFSKVITQMPQQGVSQVRFDYLNESREELLPVLAELASMIDAY